MPLDPNIILGARSPQIDFAQLSPVNALTGVMKFKQLDQENKINALKMQEYERARTEEEGLRNYLSGGRDVPAADLSSPDTRTNLLRYGKTGATYAKALTEQETAALTQKETQFKVQKARREFIAQTQRDTSQNPSDANITAYKEDLMANPLFTEAEKTQLAAGADRILAMPVGERTAFMASQGASASELKPTTFAQDLGPSGRLMSRPAFGGPATLVAGSEYTKGKTFADLTAERQASTSAGQLGLAQAKFAFEKANPTMSIQEDPSGLLAVNTRTGVATPVVYGSMGIQAAPAAAPTAGPSVMRQQGAGMPGERVSAIPGMTSVLDRNVAPAAMPLVAQGGERMPGMPVVGKEKPMTETQSNATAYGMRMKEANTILEDLAKKGVLKGAVIEATPLIGGTLGQVLPSALGGTSAAQQQVNQAKSNFITAVLRKESGAVISDSEFDREDKKYFPQINDNAAVIKQKENARKLAIKAIEVQAGPGAKEIQKYQPSVGGLTGASANDPLGLGIR
jgi:hypothetical protein